MTLAGTLRQMNLEEVLRVIEEERRTGLLIVSNANLSAEIYLSHDFILCVQRSGSGQSLAERIITAHLVTSQQIGHVRSMYQQEITTEVDLARALIQANMLSSKQLRNWAADDAVELLVVLLSWSEGEFDFEEGMTPELGRMVIEIPIQAVLEEALHHIAQRRQRVSAARIAVTPDLVLDFAGQLEPPSGEVQVTPEQWQFLTAIDGRVPLFAVGKALRLSRHDTLRLASELLSSKILEVRGLARDGSVRAPASAEEASPDASPSRMSRPRIAAQPRVSRPGPAVQRQVQGRQRFTQ